VFERCKEFDIPVLSLMGGGYARDIQESADAHIDVYENAVHVLND
jgi:acetoin utilization deacetylase AcuC-like enzyme